MRPRRKVTTKYLKVITIVHSSFLTLTSAVKIELKKIQLLGWPWILSFSRMSIFNYWLEFSVAYLPMILPMFLSGTVMVSVMIGGCAAMTCLISSSACCALVWVPRTTTVRLSLPPSIGASSLKLTLAPVRSWIWINKCQRLYQIYFTENMSLSCAGEKKKIYWRKKNSWRYTC